MIGLAILASASFFGDAALDAALRRAPPPVREFVVRKASCNHWAGEEPYDADRRREIERALRLGRCDRIDADEVRIRSRYGKLPDTIMLLDAASTAD